jgi:hypothetical protein
MTTKGITITWGMLGKMFGALASMIIVFYYLSLGVVWGLEHHFDDRYLLVGSSLEGELRKLEREIWLQQQNGGDPAYIKLLQEQRDQIQADLDKSNG